MVVLASVGIVCAFGALMLALMAYLSQMSKMATIAFVVCVLCTAVGISAMNVDSRNQITNTRYNTQIFKMTEQAPSFEESPQK